MSASRGNDVYRHPFVKQQRLMGPAQIVEAQLGEPQPTRSTHKAPRHRMRVTRPCQASRGGEHQRVGWELNEAQVNSGDAIRHPRHQPRFALPLCGKQRYKLVINRDGARTALGLRRFECKSAFSLVERTLNPQRLRAHVEVGPAQR